MRRKTLLLLLAVAAILELVLAVGGFVAPKLFIEAFKIQVTSDTLFLGFVISWLLLFIACTCVLALFQVREHNRNGWILSILLGVWWIGIGLGIYLAFGRPDNLFLDTLKGALIVVAATRSIPPSGTTTH